MRISDWSSDVCSSDLTWTRMRTHSILTRSSQIGSARMAHTIRDMVNATAAYIGTITIINLSLGALVALVVGLLGMPTRSEERRVGKECGSTCRSRWSPYP